MYLPEFSQNLNQFAQYQFAALDKIKAKFQYYYHDQYIIQVSYGVDAAGALIFSLQKSENTPLDHEVCFYSLIELLNGRNKDEILEFDQREWEFSVRDVNHKPAFSSDFSLQFLEEFLSLIKLNLAGQSEDRYLFFKDGPFTHLATELKIKYIRVSIQDFLKSMIGAGIEMELVELDENCLVLDIRGPINHLGLLEKYQDFAVNMFRDYEINCILDYRTQ